ncbi:FAD-dependent oxidoreductase [Clostridium sp. AM58-1XD]|uniref:FAD-dependent oxidoreductase n=1 Tax=Clostridium sp. AM58-1XD TaxID=2292307 RepID=UPI000E470914|nr:FAD-dependent oxidoreductase [Clostridium sp. AM58-1XD]RGZ01552.1 pyridine nucleotide-disulfide oxidoreductase [Clostridium sp. AM58-1XD]
MKVLVIGGVAAGTKAAAKMKRVDRSAEVTIITKDKDISYAGCGLPYYVGGMIQEESDLIVNTPQKYAALTGVEVLTGREAFDLDSAGKEVKARNLQTGEEEVYHYDVCIVAVGASSIVPNMPGVSLNGVFKMRTPEDAVTARRFIEEKKVRRAVVAGGGFIGLEVAENLKEQGVSVTVVDLAPQVLPNVFDSEMAGYVKKHLKKQGIRVITGAKIEEIRGEDGKVTGVQTSEGLIPADMAVLSIGIRPNTAFLKESGMEMERGTITVDGRLRTNLPDVYAAGDCAMVKNRLTGRRQWSPMGSSANYEGRTLAQVLGGAEKEYPGVLGTGVVKLPGLNAGRTGLTEAQAGEAGYDVETVLAVTDDKAHYYPGASMFMTKLIADKRTHKLLGVQVLGSGAVDKMVDIAVTGISMGAVLEDFENMDLSYAPPFSTAIHPFVQAVYMMLNKLDGDMISMTPAEYEKGEAKGWRVLDAGQTASIPGATWVNLAGVKGEIEGIGKDEKLLLVCAKGKRAYFLQNRMRFYGYTNTVVLEGATTFNDVKVEGVKCALSPDDVTRVKGLGFLRDKRTEDKFNGRIITRNGKVTAEENRVISEAAEKFGSGDITMTSRLTLEIQGVPYENIEPLREYLAQAGLETGGTGSKVRPVVSCKGTTCQYGLIDTFALSEEIHERFYHGYSQVKLPHKFKIAVGGCPNNCVKPDLNDLGVIGQKVPVVDMEKCRGCKVCQVVDSCPIQIAGLEDGRLRINMDECNHCGRCSGKCPFGALEGHTDGYKVYIGGRWGKKVAHGQALEKIFTTEEEVLNVIEKAILLFREQGITGERFADTIGRIGFENVQEQLLADELLQRKEENLTAEKHLKGGATC